MALLTVAIYRDDVGARKSVRREHITYRRVLATLSDIHFVEVTNVKVIGDQHILLNK